MERALRKNFNRADGGSTLLWAIGGILIASLLYTAYCAVFGDEDGIGTFLANILLSQGCIAAAYFLSARFRGNAFFRPARAESFQSKYLLFMPIAAVVLYGFYPAAFVFTELLAKINFVVPEPYMPMGNAWELILTLVTVCALPAVVEELIFRGAVFRSMEEKPVRAMLVSAAAFALFHGNPDQTIYQFLFGLVLAYAVYRTGSIYPAMLLHFCSNALVVLFAYFEVPFFMPETLWLGAIFAVGCMLAAAVILVILTDLIAGRRLFSLFKREPKPVDTAGNIYAFADNTDPQEKAVRERGKLIYVLCFVFLAIEWLAVLIMVAAGFVTL